MSLIETVTVPTIVLGGTSRLLLRVGGGDYAFTQSHLQEAVVGYTKDMESVVCCHGRPEQSCDRVAYLAPNGGDKAEDRAFAGAVDWLSYMGRAATDGHGRVWLIGKPL